MGYDALPDPEGVFFNKIKSSKNLFEDQNSKIFDYIGASFEKRSGVLELLQQIGILRDDDKINQKY